MTYEEALKKGLTPQEKVEIYQRALITLSDCGICAEILCQFDDWLEGKPSKDTRLLKQVFPEFTALKPKNKAYTKFWFKSNVERIEVLNKLIEGQKQLIRP